MAGRCWLLKTEADCFSIQDLAKAPRQTTHWSGVRNYQARNFMRDGMKLGDRVLLYHSNAEPSAVVGTAHVVGESYPDHTAWDKSDCDYDPKASAANPIWLMVDIRLDSIFDHPLSLAELREVPELKGMELLRKGSRLSVQPVTPVEFATILRLAKSASAEAVDAPAKTSGTFRKANAKKPATKNAIAARRPAGTTAKKSRRPARAR
jgi:predicted RNA-binding protein with PUA-like domain